MTYKFFAKYENRILDIIIIVLSGLLLLFIFTNFNSFSYNKGYYDGIISMCDDEGVIIVNGVNRCVGQYLKENNFGVKIPKHNFDDESNPIIDEKK